MEMFSFLKFLFVSSEFVKTPCKALLISKGIFELNVDSESIITRWTVIVVECSPPTLGN